MCRWRDEQLALGKAPKEVGAGHDWYFVEGIPASAETSPAPRGTRGVVMGVADEDRVFALDVFLAKLTANASTDGVGGWEDSGVDPSHFAQALMWFARERVRTQGWSWPDAEAARNGDSLKALLDGAFEDVTRDKGVVAGSSTACLAALDAETGMLHAANLGDSGFLVLRPHPVDALPPTPPASPTTPDGEKDPSAPEAPPEPTTTYAVVHAQEPQVHFFNAPRQLSKIPQAELDRAAGEGKGEGNWLVDRPGDADTVAVQLQDGDVVMLFTDGYSDNVWPQGETDRLLELVRTRVDLAPSASTSRATADKELAASVAQTAVTFARMLAVRPDVYTPFAAESKRWGVKGMERGGKVDDVTVLVAVVRREAESAESAAAA